MAAATTACLRSPTTAAAQQATTRPRRAPTVCALPRPGDALKRTGAALASGLLASSLLLAPGANAGQVPTPSSITGERMGVPNARDRLKDADVEDVRQAVEQGGRKLEENVKGSANKLVDTVKAIKPEDKKKADVSMARAPALGDLAFGNSSNLPGEAGRAVSDPKGKAQSDINRLKRDTSSAVQDAKRNLPGEANRAVSDPKGKVKSDVDSLKRDTSSTVDSLKRDTSSAVQDAKDGASRLGEEVKQGVKGPFEQLKKGAEKALDNIPTPGN